MAGKSIFAILNDLKEGMEELHEALSPLAAIAVQETPRAMRRARRVVKKTGRKISRSARRAMPPALKEMRRLQGRYMALVRRLTKAQQGQVKKLRASKGYKEALRLAEKFHHK